jgi:two-component system nitrate/nitrite response regulator NarL
MHFGCRCLSFDFKFISYTIFRIKYFISTLNFDISLPATTRWWAYTYLLVNKIFKNKFYTYLSTCMKKDKILLAIVDDHQIVIDGLKSLLSGQPDFVVVVESNHPESVPDLLAKNKIDILLTDIMMPVMNGAELAKVVREKFPEIKILALSMSGQGDLVNQMIEDSDIAGYVLKNIGKQELITALEKISRGGIYFSQEVLDEMLKASEKKKNIEEVRLTTREIEIIQLIEKEYGNKQIADTLFISERTVETHRKNIFRKTKTSSLIGLIKYAYENKLI